MDVTLTTVNETLAITNSDSHKLIKITPGCDCAIVGLIAAVNQCKLVTLPEKNDVWISTPMHNSLAYYTTEKIEMVCQQSREIIQQQSGIINVPTHCVIETPKRTIIHR